MKGGVVAVEVTDVLFVLWHEPSEVHRGQHSVAQSAARLGDLGKGSAGQGDGNCEAVSVAGQKMLVTGARDAIAASLDISCDCIERVLPKASVDVLPGHDFMPRVLGLLRAVADKGGGCKATYRALSAASPTMPPLQAPEEDLSSAMFAILKR
jgi:hypothetical protein